jgi:hypothetical protein
MHQAFSAERAERAQKQPADSIGNVPTSTGFVIFASRPRFSDQASDNPSQIQTLSSAQKHLKQGRLIWLIVHFL